MEGGMDTAAFADWLSLDERLRRAIEKKEQPAPDGEEVAGPPPPVPSPPPPRTDERV
jgi:hypothetical protein